MNWRRKLIVYWNLLPWTGIGRRASIGGVVSLLLLIFSVIPSLKETKSDVEHLSKQVASQDAFLTLKQYHYLIEQQELEKARNMFSEEKKVAQTDGFTGFQNWHGLTVSFQGIKITPIEEKNSASSKVYLVEYDLDRRGFKPVDMLLGFTVRYNGEIWEIHRTTFPLRENDKRDVENACSFYDFEGICS